MAGINAALQVKGEPPLILDRSQAYIGVLIDDLITKDAREPYRMFTSRAEYRLLLREDNADQRLMETGHRLGLVLDELYEKFQEKQRVVEFETRRLSQTRLPWTLEQAERWTRIEPKLPDPGATLAQLLKRPEVSYNRLMDIAGEADPVTREIGEAVEISIKYDGYIKRQLEQIEKFQKLEGKSIPANFRYDRVTGFSNEVAEKLSKVRPATVGQASRISGVTPAAISLLLVALERFHRSANVA